MIAQLSENQRTRLLLAGISLVPGLVYYLSHEFWPDDPTSRGLVVAAIFFVTGLALTNHLAWTGSNFKRMAVVASILPIMFALAAFWVWQQIPTEEVPYQLDDARIPAVIIGAEISLFLLLPLIQIFQQTGRRSYQYSDLFRRYWDNLFVIALAGFIMGAFWLVIFLWSELFKLIDVSFFEDIFTHAAFVSLSLSAVCGYSIALGKERDRLTATLRNILLAVLKALMPMLAVIALIFLVALPFTGLQPLWDTNHASFTLIWLLVLMVLFFNGAYQDGTDVPPYPKWLSYVVQAALVSIPIYALITYWALFLRIDQHGLTTVRFYGVLFASAGLLYGLGYAVSVFRRSGTWMEMVRRVNMGMVFVVVTCAFLINTPVLDPLRWSARNQFNRLAGEQVDAAEFDYGYLRFQLGHVGFATLADIEALTDHPQAEAIREGVQAAREAESYWTVRPQPTTVLSTEDIELLHTGDSLPDGLLEFLSTALEAYQARECEEEGECTLFTVSLDDDEQPEYGLVLSGDTYYTIRLFDRDSDGMWIAAGTLQRITPSDDWPDREGFLDSLRVVGYETAVPNYRDLVVGGFRLRAVR